MQYCSSCREFSPLICTIFILYLSSHFLLHRFVLFEKEDDAAGKLVDKFRDDSRQLRSIVTALQLPSTYKLDKFAKKFVLDVNKACRVNEENVGDTSSSCDEFVSGEEGDSSLDEHLTDPW